MWTGKKKKSSTFHWMNSGWKIKKQKQKKKIYIEWWRQNNNFNNTPELKKKMKQLAGKPPYIGNDIRLDPVENLNEASDPINLNYNHSLFNNQVLFQRLNGLANKWEVALDPLSDKLHLTPFRQTILMKGLCQPSSDTFNIHFKPFVTYFWMEPLGWRVPLFYNLLTYSFPFWMYWGGGMLLG